MIFLSYLNWYVFLGRDLLSMGFFLINNFLLFTLQNGIKERKEEVKLSLLADDMIWQYTFQILKTSEKLIPLGKWVSIHICLTLILFVWSSFCFLTCFFSTHGSLRTFHALYIYVRDPSTISTTRTTTTAWSLPVSHDFLPADASMSHLL